MNHALGEGQCCWGMDSHEDKKTGAEIFFRNTGKWTLFVLLETDMSLLRGCFWFTNQENPMLVNFFLDGNL